MRGDVSWDSLLPIFEQPFDENYEMASSLARPAHGRSPNVRWSGATSFPEVGGDPETVRVGEAHWLRPLPQPVGSFFAERNALG